MLSKFEDSLNEAEEHKSKLANVVAEKVNLDELHADAVSKNKTLEKQLSALTDQLKAVQFRMNFKLLLTNLPPGRQFQKVFLILKFLLILLTLSKMKPAKK